MLDGLEKVEWSRLHHAYGPAETTPLQLRALLSEDPQMRERAMGGLENTLIHQGTIYDATLHAIPFLLELLALPSFAQQEDVLRLLANCAEGSFPDRYVVEDGSLLSELDPPTPEQRRELAQRRAIVGQTQAAVRAGQAIYAHSLADANAAVRQAALTVLTTAPVAQDRAWLAAVLRSRLSAEADQGMRVALTRFLGECQPLDADTQALLTDCWQTDANPLVRLASAVALATGLRTEAPPAVAEDVADALTRLDMDVAQRYNDAVFYEDAVGHRRWTGADSWYDLDVTLDLALALRALGERGRAVALPRLTRALATWCAELAGRGEETLPAGYWRMANEPHAASDGTEQEPTVEERRIYVRYGLNAPELQVAKALLTLTFGMPLPRQDRQRHAVLPADLSHEQKSALASLLGCEAIWHVEAIVRIDTLDIQLSERGLPDTRETLRDYLAQARREQA